MSPHNLPSGLPVQGAGRGGAALGRTLVRWFAFPASLAGAVLVPEMARAKGLPAELALMVVLALALAWVRLAETVAPYDPSAQRPQGKDRRVDASALAVMMLLVDPALKSLWPLLAVAVAGVWTAPAQGFWSGGNPLWVTVPVALLVSGLGEYLLHRVSHVWKPMWGFHALHHSAQRIYWLNGFRVHPLNVAWHQAGGYFILLLLGVDRTTLTLVSALAIVVSAFQHANADLVLGPLNQVFSTNALHRWHHDSRPGRSYVNYGSVLSVWDRLLGTYYLPATQRAAQPGLEPASRAGVDAQSYLAQVVAPIRHWGQYPGRFLSKE